MKLNESISFFNTVRALQHNPKRWLITGVAGFIGSNLLQHLLQHKQYVVGLDNLSTGYQSNLDQTQAIVGAELWKNFSFIHGDIRDLQTCHQACINIDYVLQQAALGSVPRSLQDPIATNSVNVDGFLNMLVAARDAHVMRFIYASSSATYGDHETLPKIEEQIGAPLSPYAVTKYVNELFASVFSRSYGLNTVGLRYFNVFGPRQDRRGSYAAVIPKWITDMLQQKDIYVYGDGKTSRDFCYVDNVVQANILAATSEHYAAFPVYNIAVQSSTTLNQLFQYLCDELAILDRPYHKSPIYQDNRLGDIKHSLADISKAKTCLGYEPQYNIQSGIKHTLPWYISQFDSGSTHHVDDNILHDTVVS